MTAQAHKYHIVALRCAQHSSRCVSANNELHSLVRSFLFTRCSERARNLALYASKLLLRPVSPFGHRPFLEKKKQMVKLYLHCVACSPNSILCVRVSSSAHHVFKMLSPMAIGNRIQVRCTPCASGHIHCHSAHLHLACLMLRSIARMHRIFTSTVTHNNNVMSMPVLLPYSNDRFALKAEFVHISMARERERERESERKKERGDPLGLLLLRLLLLLFTLVYLPLCCLLKRVMITWAVVVAHTASLFATAILQKYLA